MGKKRRILLAVLLVAVFGGIALLLIPSPEPVYEGKPLSAWLHSVQTNWLIQNQNQKQEQKQDRLAILQIGSNGIKELLEMARAKDSPLKKQMMALARKQTLIPIIFHTAQDDHVMAGAGFEILGATGRDAVPALIDLLKSEDVDVRLTAADCLGKIGPNAKAAIPFLLQSLDDTDRIVRLDATFNLGEIHMQPDMAVPVLINKLN